MLYRAIIVGISLLVLVHALFCVDVSVACETACTKVGTVYTCTDVANDCIDAAVDAADSGDTIQLASGATATWTGTAATVTWTNKNLTLIGLGTGPTITLDGSDGIIVTVTDGTKGSFRISNITFAGNTTGESNMHHIFGIYAQSANSIPSGWRIDHITATMTGYVEKFLYVYGVSYGVVDSCTYTASGPYVYFFHQNGWNSVLDAPYTQIGEQLYGGYNMAQPLDLGGASAIYLENNTINATRTDANTVLNDIDTGGSRVVWRYNTIYGGLFYMHETRQNHATWSKWEMYNNIIDGTGPTDAVTTQEFIGRLEAGTGVIYNNIISGYTSATIALNERRGTQDLTGILTPMNWCDGTMTHTWDGNAECKDAGGSLETANPDGSCPSGEGWTNTGWPCLGQVGRAPGIAGEQTSAPWFAWNNTGAATILAAYSAADAPYVRSQASPHANGEFEYYNASNFSDAVAKGLTATYAPYRCPHPLVTEYSNYTCDTTKAGVGAGGGYPGNAAAVTTLGSGASMSIGEGAVMTLQ